MFLKIQKEIGPVGTDITAVRQFPRNIGTSRWPPRRLFPSYMRFRRYWGVESAPLAGACQFTSTLVRRRWVYGKIIIITFVRVFLASSAASGRKAGLPDCRIPPSDPQPTPHAHGKHAIAKRPLLLELYELAPAAGAELDHARGGFIRPALHLVGHLRRRGGGGARRLAR